MVEVDTDHVTLTMKDRSASNCGTRALHGGTGARPGGRRHAQTIHLMLAKLRSRIIELHGHMGVGVTARNNKPRVSLYATPLTASLIAYIRQVVRSSGLPEY